MAAPAHTPTSALLQALVAAQKALPATDPTTSDSAVAQARVALNGAGLALLTRGGRIFSIGTRLEGAPPREVPQLFTARRWSLVHEAGAVLELEEQVWPVAPTPGQPLDHAMVRAEAASFLNLLVNVLQLARPAKAAA